MQSRVKVTTRCPECWERIWFSDMEDPDEGISKHLKKWCKKVNK